MKMMRWFLGLFFIVGVLFFLLGAEPSRAATVSTTPTSCDEHPWDKLKGAYRVEVVVVTDEYMLLAVWYTKDQIYPVFIWVKYQSQQTASSTLTGAPSGKKSFTSFF